MDDILYAGIMITMATSIGLLLSHIVAVRANRIYFRFIIRTWNMPGDGRLLEMNYIKKSQIIMYRTNY